MFLEAVAEAEAKPLPRPPAMPADAADILARQSQTITESVGWISGGTGPEHRIAIFSWGDFYIQCMKAEEPSMQCEVVSADVDPHLKPMLNAAAGRRLQKLGFLEPGYSMNYAQAFPLKAGAGDDDTKAIVGTLMRAALEAFGTYTFLPLEVKRHTTSHAATSHAG